MEKHYVDVDGYWGILFIYDFEMWEMDELADILDNFGVDEEEIPKAMRVLYGINGGMAISRPDLTMSAIIIGKASSTEQFFDTLTHEIDHVQDAIDNHYYISQGGEDSAWLQGYIMRGITKWLIQDGYICE